MRPGYGRYRLTQPTIGDECKIRAGLALGGGSPARVNNLTIHPNEGTPPLSLGANSYLLHIVVIPDIPTKT